LSYIGQEPVVGRYIKVDQISGGFNGTASGFTLTAGGQGVLPGTARNLMLSLGGVIQEPGVDFIVSGSGITFTTPPVAGTTFFCVVFGDMQAIGQPSDGTVIPASIASSGTFAFPNVTVTGTTLKVPVGTTAQRPAGVTGNIRFNSEITQYEGYTGTNWSSIGGGAKGGGADQVFFENDQVVTTNYTLTSNKNAVSAGTITINAGVTVTVPTGSNWVIV
jgi:hypothetical protein